MAAPEPVAQPVAAIPHQPAPATPAAHQPPATPASAGVYTDIVGAPPPPPPAWAPAPVPERSPLSATRHETVVGPPRPTPEAAAAAAAGADLGSGYGNSMQHPPVPDAEAAEPEQVTQALDRARQLVDAGVDRETIIGVLRLGDRRSRWWENESVYKLSKELFGPAEGSHATPSEVSVVQYLYPDHIKTAPLEPPTAPSSMFYDARDYRRRFPDGRIGSNPGLATPEHGKRLYDAAVAALADKYTRLRQRGLGVLPAAVRGVARARSRPRCCPRA